MKTSKIFFLVFLVGFLLFGCLWLRDSIQYKKDRAEWEVEVVVLDEQIIQAQAEEIEALAEAEYWKEVASKAEADVVVLEDELALKRREHEIMLTNIAIIPPDEVVSDLILILQIPDTEVTLSGLGVTFSLDASRLVLTKLTMYDFSLKEEQPNYTAMLMKKDEVIQAHKGEIKACRNTLTALYKEQAGWQAKYEGEHKLRLKAEAIPKFNLFTTKNIAIGLSVTAAIVGTVLILK